MQLDPVVGEEIVEHGLTKQRVPELIAATLVCDEYARVRYGSRRSSGSRPVEARGNGKPGAWGAGADDGRDGHEMSGVVVERREAREHQVAQCLRYSLGARRGDKLFDEERIALGVAGDPFHVGRVRIGAEQLRGELRCGLSGKSFERDSVIAETSELGDQLALRATVLGAVRHDQQDGDAPKVAGDISKESATRRVDPVHVIDDENELPRGCGTRQQLDDRLEQEALALSVFARRGIGCLE